MATAIWQSDSDPVEAASDTPGGDAAEREHRRRPLPFTTHARTRGARRNIAPDAVEYVMAYGRMIQRTGVTFYFLGRRNIPSLDRHASWASRLEGTIVLVASDGEVITLYRNRRGLRTIQRKVKYRIVALDWHQELTSATQPGVAALASA